MAPSSNWLRNPPFQGVQCGFDSRRRYQFWVVYSKTLINWFDSNTVLHNRTVANGGKQMQPVLFLFLDRLMAGQQTLTLFMLVRIQLGDPFLLPLPLIGKRADFESVNLGSSPRGASTF